MNIGWLVAGTCMVIACGAAAAPIADERVPSTDRDPPGWVPTAVSEGHTGEPVALSSAGGAEQARALLVRLVMAIRDESVEAVEATFAERVAHAQPGLARSTWTRSALARQLIAAASASHVEPSVTFDELIDPATVRAVEATAHFEGALPASVDPRDVVVSFVPTVLGRRLLAGIGGGLIVVRPGPTPQIVAR